MSDINEVRLVGNAGKDAEVRYTGTGTAVANFSLATNERWTDRSGQKQEKTEWHRIVAWGPAAEWCGQNVTKGKRVEVRGCIQTREWVDKENKKQLAFEIKALAVNHEGESRDTGGQRANNASAPSGGGPTVFPSYGRSKGAPISGASAQDLEYYAAGARKSIADPVKARWHDKERALLAAIEAEQARQGGGAAPSSGGASADPFGPPPPGFAGPSEDDIPF